MSKTPAKRKSTARSSAGSAKKGKKAAESEQDDDEEDEDEDEEANSEDDDNEDGDEGGDDSEEVIIRNQLFRQLLNIYSFIAFRFVQVSRRKRRQISGKNHPDKDGFMELWVEVCFMHKFQPFSSIFFTADTCSKMI